MAVDGWAVTFGTAIISDEGPGRGRSPLRPLLIVIVAGASPGETKMWAAVRENGDFLHLQFEYLGNC